MGKVRRLVEITRPSWAARADAVGHSVLVFAFLPALAPVPRWLAFEAGNALNRTDAVVLAFVPVRGAVLLLNAFWEGLLPGLLAGIVNGALFTAWTVYAAPRPAITTALGAGAVTGLLAALTAVTALTASLPWSSAAAFELASGVVCGTVAALGMRRLLDRR